MIVFGFCKITSIPRYDSQISCAAGNIETLWCYLLLDFEALDEVVFGFREIASTLCENAQISQTGSDIQTARRQSFSYCKGLFMVLLSIGQVAPTLRDIS